MKTKANKRHIIKSISWRLIATFDTMILVYLISGSLESGIKVGFLEIFSKLLLFYFHEKFWFSYDFKNFYKIRHLIKTFSWRIFGTIDTILISIIITGNINSALKIGLLETITKMLLYYIHEKLWYRTKFGIKNV